MIDTAEQLDFVPCFDAAHLTRLAADAALPDGVRLAALNVLSVGVRETCYLRIDDVAVTMSMVTYMIVRHAVQRGHIEQAVHSLQCFTGLVRGDCCQLVERLFDA